MEKPTTTASYKDGKAHLNAYLDDYAYLLQALIELLQARWDNKYYTWALQIADSLLEHLKTGNREAFSLPAMIMKLYFIAAKHLPTMQCLMATQLQPTHYSNWGY